MQAIQNFFANNGLDILGILVVVGMLVWVLHRPRPKQGREDFFLGGEALNPHLFPSPSEEEKQ